MGISIIVPALNEQNNITATLNNIQRALIDFSIESEIIVINDGSTDKTADIVAKIALKDPRIRIISHQKPHGIGSSFWHGVSLAKCEFVVMLPGDNENDPWEILRYVRLLEHVDVVIPFLYNKEARSLPRRLLSFVYRSIINTTFLVNFNYTNGTVLYRKSILDELKYHSSGFFFQTDILIRIVCKGYLFAEVPYRINQRHFGVSKAVSFPSLVNVAKGYLQLCGDMYFSKNGGLQKTEDFASDSSTKRRAESNERLVQTTERS